MKRNTYYPVRQNDQIVWLGNFSNKLPALTATLGLSAVQVSAAVADCGWLIYILQSWLPAGRAWSLASTDAVADALSGDGTALMALPVFTAPALPTGVAPTNTGALDRIFALVQSIKDSGKCSDTNATNLGIIGTTQTGPDLTTVQPVIAASLSGNQVNVKWGWGGNSAFLDSCEIQVDRADGKGYVLLTIDTTPGYTDTQPFPTAKTVWTYRAIYQVNDARVGVWSQSVSVAVQA
jgi:hypothetical protein